MTGNLLFLEKSTPLRQRNRYKAEQNPEIRTKIVVALEKNANESRSAAPEIDSRHLLLRSAVKTFLRLAPK